MANPLTAGARLPRSFYQRDPVVVARQLLGQRLVRVLADELVGGRIVETEAYLGIPDKAAHTYRGRNTERNASMWLQGGHAYVYFTYGMHHCLNVVAGRAGEPVAVLIRALEPELGIASMYRRRAAARRDTDLCSGPAKLCQALAVDRRLDGEDLVNSEALFIEPGGAGDERLADGEIAQGPRVGVDYAEEWRDEPLRFWMVDNPHVSR